MSKQYVSWDDFADAAAEAGGVIELLYHGFRLDDLPDAQNWWQGQVHASASQMVKSWYEAVEHGNEMMEILFAPLKTN